MRPDKLHGDSGMIGQSVALLVDELLIHEPLDRLQGDALTRSIHDAIDLVVTRIRLNHFRSINQTSAAKQSG